MLTDAQIVALLSQDGSREDMLREAFRMGMRRAAEVLREQFGRSEYPIPLRDCIDEIHAEAE